MAEQVIVMRGEFGGLGMTEHDFAREIDRIAAAGDDARILLHSEGGSVFTTLSIVSQLTRFKGRTTLEAEGLVASSATFLLPAVDRVEFHPFARTMIHLATVGTIGNKRDLIELADVLDAVDQDISRMYASRTSTPASRWLQLMAEGSGTRLSAEESVAIGLGDVVLPVRGERPTAYAVRPANHSMAANRVINSLKGARRHARLRGNDPVARELQKYADRIAVLRADQLAGERQTNLARIAANATRKGEAAKYTRWS